MRRTLALTAALLCLATVACSKDKTVTPAASATTAGPAPSATESSEASPAAPPVTLSGTTNNHGTAALEASGSIEIEADNEGSDFYFNPTFVTASAGKAVKVEFKNEGSVPHTFTITALHVDKTLQPGEQADLTFTLPAGGPVVYFCKFHQGSGMQGAFYFA